MADDFSIVVKRFDPEDPRLGRHVVHDSRSLRYLAPRKALNTLQSVKHRILIGMMDQGDVGSCTGHAGTNNMAGELFWPASRDPIGNGDPHVYAEHLYSDATQIDPWTGSWRPDDTGSDGLSIAKVLKSRGLISGYQHATSLEAVLTALAKQPVMIGASWYSGMYEVSPDGHMNVSGDTLGGHEFCLDELDVAGRRVWMLNSWGYGFGLMGRAWMTYDELAKLLADFGDCTVLVPREEPAPVPVVPTPPPSPPAPTPAPSPTPAPDDAAAAAVRTALQKFIKTSACPKYLKKAAEGWLPRPPTTSKRRSRK